MARKTKEEAQETRAAILDAAEILFQERGVSHTSLAEVATAAGVTRGAVYWHFKNKADLYDALIKRVFEPLEARLLEVQANEQGNPVEQLRRDTFYFLDQVVRDQRYFRMLEITWHKCEYVGEMVAIRNMHKACGNRYLLICEKAFRQAIEQGFFPAHLDPRCAAMGLFAVVDGLTVNWTLDKSLFPLDVFGPKIVDAYLDGLRMIKAP